MLGMVGDEDSEDGQTRRLPAETETGLDCSIGQATSCCSRSAGSSWPKGRAKSCRSARKRAPTPASRRSRRPGALDAAVRDPGIALRLRLRLAAHHDEAVVGVLLDVMVDILRDIGLAAHDEAAVAQPDILHEMTSQGMARSERREVAMRHIQAAVRMQAQRDAVMHARSIRPTPRRRCAADPDACLRADDLCDERAGAADPQQDAPDATINGLTENLIDQDLLVSAWCSIEKSAPFGSIETRRPPAFSTLTRPRSLSRGVSNRNSAMAAPFLRPNGSEGDRSGGRW